MRKATAEEIQLAALLYAAYDTWTKWKDHRDMFYPKATAVDILFEEGHMYTNWRDKATNTMRISSFDALNIPSESVESDLQYAAVRQLCHAYEQRLPLLRNTSHTLYFDIEYHRSPVLYVED